MSSFRAICIFLVGLAMIAPTAVAASARSVSRPVAAAQGKLMPDIMMQPSRFSGPGVYTGRPALAVTLSMIMAGGGPRHFDSVSLLKVLTGATFGAEVAKLTKQYGKSKVDNFLKVFNFVVSDALRIVNEKHIVLPNTPVPDPHNGPALARALWEAGQTGRGFSNEVMQDRAVSHAIHVEIMRDIDQKFGIAADADYHAVLNTAMHDLATAYGLHYANNS